MEKLFTLQQLMRWFGPGDPVSLSHIAQAGCSGVVTALHHIPVGQVWEIEDIQKHQALIAAQNLNWTVVESLPVHEEIKSQSGQSKKYIDNYKKSLTHLAACGLKVVTYNFMPVLDWLRTDVAHRLPDGAETLLFRPVDFAVVDLFLLQRPGAKDDYTEEKLKRLSLHFELMPEEKKNRLLNNLLLALPGSDESFSQQQVLALLQQYDHLSHHDLQQNLIYFLKAVIPTAERVGIQMAIHPDDPPFPVLGLPRVMSTEKDIEDLVKAVPSVANGLCFCTGSLGVRPDNDLVGMVQRWGKRIYFLHLRSTKRDGAGNFYEAPHLEGDADMYRLMKEIVLLMQREKRSIPMRPDHGHKMLDDLSKTTYPGYSAIGRLKSLAELRGLEYAIGRLLPPIPSASPPPD